MIAVPTYQVSPQTQQFLLNKFKQDLERNTTVVKDEEDLEKKRVRQQIDQEQSRFEGEMEQKRIDRELKKLVAQIIFSFLGIETLAVFLVLLLQGFKLFLFHVEDSTLNIFLGATILQISAMAIIVIQHLFPKNVT